MSDVMLTPGHGAAQPGDDPLAHLPVQGRVSPAGGLVGDLTIVPFAGGNAGQLRLTGLLNGTTAYRISAQAQVAQQTFTALATLIDSGRATDALLLEIEPIILTPRGVQIRLAQITLEINNLPSEGDVLVPLLNKPS